MAQSDSSRPADSAAFAHTPAVRGKPSASAAISPSPLVTKKRRPAALLPPRNTLLQYLDEHQLDIPVAIIACLFAAKQLGIAAVNPFLTLSYPVGPDLYGHGLEDACIVTTSIFGVTAARAAVMRFILAPLARFFGIRQQAKITRFAEQGWIVVWASFSLSYGMFIMKDAPYMHDYSYFWRDYPHRYVSGLFKYYYLMQTAFWSAQILVLHIERPRKDKFEMLLHHIVTILLVVGSYWTQLMRVGHMILCITDLSDIFLSTAKCLRYAGYRSACDITFGVFVLSWIYSRFYLLGTVTWSVYVDAPVLLPLEWDSATGHYITQRGLTFFVFLLSCLMCLMVFWFILIIRVILKVLSGTGAEDNRSDDEDEKDD